MAGGRRRMLVYAHKCPITELCVRLCIDHNAGDEEAERARFGTQRQDHLRLRRAILAIGFLPSGRAKQGQGRAEISAVWPLRDAARSLIPLGPPFISKSYIIINLRQYGTLNIYLRYLLPFHIVRGYITDMKTLQQPVISGVATFEATDLGQ